MRSTGRMPVNDNARPDTSRRYAEWDNYCQVILRPRPSPIPLPVLTSIQAYFPFWDHLAHSLQARSSCSSPAAARESCHSLRRASLPPVESTALKKVLQFSLADSAVLCMALLLLPPLMLLLLMISTAQANCL